MFLFDTFEVYFSSNKVPRTYRLKIIQIYSIIVLKGRSLKVVLRPKSRFQSDIFFPEGLKESLFFCFLRFLALEAAFICAPPCLEPAGAMRVFTPQSL